MNETRQVPETTLQVVTPTPKRALWEPHMALFAPDGESGWAVILNGPCPWELKADCPTEDAARAAMRLLSM